MQTNQKILSAVAGGVILAVVGVVAVSALTDDRDPDAFVQQAHEFMPSLAKVSDKELIREGDAMCDQLAAGATPYQVIVTYAFDQSYSGKQIGALLTTSAFHLCPEYKDQVEQIGD